MAVKKILLVDDEPDILELIHYNLEQEGYEVELASNGLQGLEKARQFKPDLILLDVMMPEMDGVETCLELRKEESFKDTLIVFLTARSEDYSQIAGLDAGADDYITKPIKPRVLLSRVKALFRREQKGVGVASGPVEDLASGIRVDREAYLVYKDEEKLVLPRKEFELLSLLLSKSGKVFTRDEILNSVWGNDVIVGDRTIDVHIRKLREKIGADKIQTIKGVGYKFEG